jgi:hypothetical protein
MTEELWGGVDRYVSDHLIPTDFMSEAAVIASEAAGLPMPSPLLDTARSWCCIPTPRLRDGRRRFAAAQSVLTLRTTASSATSPEASRSAARRRASARWARKRSTLLVFSLDVFRPEADRLMLVSDAELEGEPGPSPPLSGVVLA